MITMHIAVYDLPPGHSAPYGAFDLTSKSVAYGMSPQEALGASIMEQLLHADDHEQVMLYVRRLPEEPVPNELLGWM